MAEMLMATFFPLQNQVVAIDTVSFQVQTQLKMTPSASFKITQTENSITR